jgi:nitrogen fixation NifU-like protein
MPVDDIQRLYQEHVIDHYEDPYHRGSCLRATHADEGENPLCGDEIRVELRIGDDGRIAEAWFSGDGCCISQASASMLMEAVEGKTVDEAKRFSAENMLGLFGAPLTPNRQKCCLLAWRILQQALYSRLATAQPRSAQSPGRANAPQGRNS